MLEQISKIDWRPRRIFSDGRVDLEDWRGSTYHPFFYVSSKSSSGTFRLRLVGVYYTRRILYASSVLLLPQTKVSILLFLPFLLSFININ